MGNREAIKENFEYFLHEVPTSEGANIAAALLCIAYELGEMVDIQDAKTEIKSGS